MHSGIPQGGVVAQVLFILYVNDLPDVLASSYMMFANDTKVYTQVNNDAQSNKLQQDLCNLIDWAGTWQL